MTTMFFALEELNNKEEDCPVIVKLQHVYHYISGHDKLNAIKEMGLCSPLYLKENYPKIFKKTSFKVWEDRVKKELKKDKVTDDDIINYLNSNKKRKGLLGASTLFFLFLPLCYYDIKIRRAFSGSIQCQIPLSILKPKTPHTVYKGRIEKTTWDTILKKPFFDSIISDTKNGPGKYLFSNISHLAVNIDNIPGNQMIIQKI